MVGGWWGCGSADWRLSPSHTLPPYRLPMAPSLLAHGLRLCVCIAQIHPWWSCSSDLTPLPPAWSLRLCSPFAEKLLRLPWFHTPLSWSSQPCCPLSCLCSKDLFPPSKCTRAWGSVLGQLLLAQHCLQWGTQQDSGLQMSSLSFSSQVHIQSTLLNSSLVFLSPYSTPPFNCCIVELDLSKPAQAIPPNAVPPPPFPVPICGHCLLPPA